MEISANRLIEALIRLDKKERDEFLEIQDHHYSRARLMAGRECIFEQGKFLTYIPAATLESGILKQMMVIIKRLKTDVKNEYRDTEVFKEQLKVIGDFLDLYGVINRVDGDYHITFNVPDADKEHFVKVTDAIIALCEERYAKKQSDTMDRDKKKDSCLQGLTQKKTEGEAE